MKNHEKVDESIRSMVIDSIQSVVNMETIKKIHHEHRQKKKGMNKSKALMIEFSTCDNVRPTLKFSI